MDAKARVYSLAARLNSFVPSRSLPPETMYRIDGINRLLDDIGEEDRILDDILRDGQFEREQIRILRRDHADEFTRRLAERWHSWMLEAIRERRAEVIFHRYSLGGQPPLTLEAIGQIYGVTRERIRQIQASALRYLQVEARKRRLEEIVLEVAREILAG